MIPRRRTLGHSEVEVGELAFGAAGIGNLFTPVTDADAEAAVAAAWESGVRYFDTAPHYGLGGSWRGSWQSLRGRPQGKGLLFPQGRRMVG
ncbi:aldo/keto reductase, partial [Kitasatospora sp. NPDC056531]|uniref:aldo/keto reductase n=1 Tax=Kitasatospora sp. NPDC056531 TaxID=3345856 RepID=UPI003685FD25